MGIKVKDKDNIQGKIKVSLPITDENLGYKHHLGITDEDIYYFLGRKAVGIEAPLKINSKARAERATYNKEQLIDYAKTSLMPLVPDEEEFIPRDYWCPFEELLGSNINNESHPVWQLSHRVIKDNFIKNSDTILIQACGNIKPYIDNFVYQWSLEMHRKGYCDLFVSSWELTPIDFSPFFPWRYYDWSHDKETPFMTDCCITHEFRNICDFVEYFGYKKIILFAPGNPDHFYVELNRRLQNHFKGSEVEVLFAWEDDVIQECKDFYNIHSQGILKSRYHILKQGKDRVKNWINYDPNKYVSPEEWHYSIKNKELMKYLRRNKEDKFDSKEKSPKPKKEKPKIKKLDLFFDRD